MLHLVLFFAAESICCIKTLYPLTFPVIKLHCAMAIFNFQTKWPSLPRPLEPPFRCDRRISQASRWSASKELPTANPATLALDGLDSWCIAKGGLAGFLAPVALGVEEVCVFYLSPLLTSVGLELAAGSEIQANLRFNIFRFLPFLAFTRGVPWVHFWLPSLKWG